VRRNEGRDNKSRPLSYDLGMKRTKYFRYAGFIVRLKEKDDRTLTLEQGAPAVRENRSLARLPKAMRPYARGRIAV